MKPLVIVGAGGLGCETVALVEAINATSESWHLRGFADDDAALHDRTILGQPVLGSTDWLAQQRDLHYVIAIGAPAVRQRLHRRLEGAALQAATLVHPDVPLHPSNTVGAGSVLCRGTSLTVSIEVGDHVFVNLHCTIGHDVRLAPYTTLHPGVHLSGNVHLGEAVEMGTGSVVLPGVSVGEETVVGAGAVVHRDLPARCTAMGVPARPRPR